MTNTVVSETNPCVSEAMALLGEANDLTYACRVKIIEARSQGLRCENCTVCPDTCRVAILLRMARRAQALASAALRVGHRKPL